MTAYTFLLWSTDLEKWLVLPEAIALPLTVREDYHVSTEIFGKATSNVVFISKTA